MKKFQLYFLSVMILITTINVVALSSNAKEVSIKELRATPEEYSNKNIVISTYYSHFIPNFPGWLTYRGFDSDKYYYLKTAPTSVPFLLRKKSDAGKSLMEIKNKSKVIVYGKVKKFRKITTKYRKRLAAKFPQYYLEVDKIEQVETTPKKKKSNKKTAPKKKEKSDSESNSVLPSPKL